MTVRENRTRNPRGEGERLRCEIVEAAAALIAEEGQEAVSLRAIARRVGITAPAIYAHFADLDLVVEAVVDSTFDDLAEYLRRGARGRTEPADRLRALCRAYVAFGREHPQEYAILFSRPVKFEPTGAVKAIENMQGGEAFSILLDAVRDCVAVGASRSMQPIGDATAVWVALHGFVGLRSAIPDFPWPPADALLDALVDRLALLT
jgi:AcrR family transcriptional regulator